MISVLKTYQKLLEQILINPSNGSAIKIEINGDNCNLICIASKQIVGSLNKGVIEFSNQKLANNTEMEQTIEMFGHEWQHYSKWGWLDQLPNKKNAEFSFQGGLRKNSKKSLFSKTRTNPNDFKDKLVLEGGCGNGRHSQFAKEGTKLLVSIDPSVAIYEAAKNLKDADNIIFIKSSLLNLPFAENTFDFIFSIGVLQHTGDPEKALSEVSRCLKPKGIFGLNCYGRGYWPYEILDYTLRTFITKWSIERKLKFAEGIANASIFLVKNNLNFLYKIIMFFININPSMCIMYDWYSPSLADHYSRKKLKGWLDKYGFLILDSNIEINRFSIRYLRHKLNHSAFNMKLKRKP